MLELENVTFHYPDHQFNLNLELPTGSCVALSGPSGIGKSTLLDIIAGFLTPASGEIIWNNQSLLSVPIAKRPVAYLLQSHQLFDHLSVQENIHLGLYSLPKSKRSEMARNYHILLQAAGLQAFDKQKAARLSGGQRQRVALVRLLMQGQALWLLDEPFNGLDEEIKSSMYSLLKRWQSWHKATILFTTHHEKEIVSFATHTAKMVYSSNQTTISRLTPLTSSIPFS